MSDELLRRIVTDPGVIADPYPLLRELRETSPVHKLGFADYWILSRFEDCRAVLRDQRLGKPGAGDLVPSLRGAPTRDAGGDRSMLFLNPPDHTRIRALVSRAFTPRRVEQLRASIETMTAELLDDLAAGGGDDLMARLAFPLPANVISELVGIPRSERDWLRPLILDLAATLEPGRGAEDAERARVSRDKVRDYLADLIDRRRAEPADDLLSGMIAAADGTDRLTQGEMVMSVILIYGAGFETTTNLIGNMVLTLLRNPDQFARLRADRSLVPATVEEVLRYEPPVQVDSRYAFEDVEVAGHVVQKGFVVMTLLGAANRDPAVIEDPDRFDVGRSEIPLLSFSSGIHYCLGASLARLEAQVVLAGLLDRFSTWTLLEESPPWKPRLTLRGLARLPVALS
ncbi:MAG: cytochrome P450 [Acidimicrobiia bacterium]|nr:cytochrome P450 [Acidimicrobiia bacterium]MYC45146.1 cytochrome P450 [Acidimicrobiia bacterium]